MKKILCMAVMLVMTAAIMMAAAGCSKHESEYDEKNEALEEALQDYMNTQETGGAADKVPDPNAPAAENVMIYVPAEDGQGLEQKMDDVPSIDDEELTKKMIEHKVLPDGAELTVFDPVNHVMSFSGVSRLTPLEAMAIINTFTENFEFPDQWELQIDGDTVMKSGYNADYKNIDNTYEGGAEDFDANVSSGGPGEQ